MASSLTARAKGFLMKAMQTLSPVKTHIPSEYEHDQVYLNSKVSRLRSKMNILGKLGTALPKEAGEIEKKLQEAEQRTDIRERTNSYQLAEQLYILITPEDELPAILLDLQSRMYRLDKSNKEIWTDHKLEQIQKILGRGNVRPRLRHEIATLARAIGECGSRYSRDSDSKSRVVGKALRLTLSSFLLTIGALIFSEAIGIHAPWTKLLIALFGVSGGLLSATIQVRTSSFHRSSRLTETTTLYFRAVFGAVAAVILSMGLELHLVGFPLLQSSTGEQGNLPETVFYLLGFASGFTDRIFFRAMKKGFG